MYWINRGNLDPDEIKESILIKEKETKLETLEELFDTGTITEKELNDRRNDLEVYYNEELNIIY